MRPVAHPTLHFRLSQHRREPRLGSDLQQCTHFSNPRKKEERLFVKSSGTRLKAVASSSSRLMWRPDEAAICKKSSCIVRVYKLTVVETEDVVKDIVRATAGHELEGLAEAHRHGLLVDHHATGDKDEDGTVGGGLAVQSVDLWGDTLKGQVLEDALGSGIGDGLVRQTSRQWQPGLGTFVPQK